MPRPRRARLAAAADGSADGAAIEAATAVLRRSAAVGPDLLAMRRAATQQRLIEAAVGQAR